MITYKRMMRELLLALPFLFSAIMPFLGAEEAYAQLSSLQHQIPPSSNAMPVVMEIVHEMKNFELGPKKDSLIVKEDGVYFFIASGQIGAVRPNATGNIDLWFVKNGIGIPDSTCRESLDKGNAAGLAISQFVTYLSKGDTVSTHFATSRPALGLAPIEPKDEPMIPSFLFSIFKIKSDGDGK